MSKPNRIHTHCFRTWCQCWREFVDWIRNPFVYPWGAAAQNGGTPKPCNRTQPVKTRLLNLKGFIRDKAHGGQNLLFLIPIIVKYTHLSGINNRRSGEARLYGVWGLSDRVYPVREPTELTNRRFEIKRELISCVCVCVG